MNELNSCQTIQLEIYEALRNIWELTELFLILKLNILAVVNSFAPLIQFTVELHCIQLYRIQWY